MNWQEVVSLILVAIAAVYLGRTCYRAVAGQRSGCGSCGDCGQADAPSGAQSFVSVDSLVASNDQSSSTTGARADYQDNLDP